jgi:adenine-specific DNA-methyltransferase
MNDATQPEKLPLTSLDIAAGKREELRRALATTFPEIAAEDRIDLDQLKRVLGDWVEPDRERFGLNWPGKAACMRVIQAPSVGTLRPRPEESVDWATTQNVFIEGDNLEVLKLLQKAYFGKIKMIYIDPPYNTGKEFIYPDKYAETLDTYLEYTGQKAADGKKFSTNSDTSGRFHSRWLNMMYPRLYLAKNLLRQDGVIFISVDDHEQPNLRIICDSIFGAENFVGPICWKNATDNNPTNIAVEHEYILCYCRSRDHLSPEWKSSISPAKDVLIEVGATLCADSQDDEALQEAYTKWYRENKAYLGPLDRYKYIDRGGVYTGSQSVHNPGKEGYRYDVMHPKTGKPCQQPLMGYRFPEETMKRMIEEGRILFGEDETKIVEIKVYANEYKAKLSSVIELDGRLGAYDVRSVFPETSKVFSNPKPVELIKELIGFATEGGDIVFDFFAGSGTTAQAVIELDASGSKRSFILVQLPEPLDTSKPEQKVAAEFCAKHGIAPNIAALARERIRRVCRAQSSAEGGKEGFKSFQLSTSCFSSWDGDQSVIADADLLKQLERHADHLAANAKSDDILFELLMKDGFQLSVPVATLKLAEKDVFSVADGALLICLDRQLSQEVIDAMAEMEPSRVICLDAGFQGNDQLKANAVQTFKARARNRETAIEFRTV